MLNRLAQLKNEIAKAQRELNKTIAFGKRITEDEQKQFAARRAEFKDEMISLDNRRAAILARQNQDLYQELTALQNKHLSAGMNAARIRHASIPGIGPKLTERLEANRIYSAADVDEFKISHIPGFGNAKVSSLIAWRYSVNSRLQAASPKNLPPEVDQAIRKKYTSGLDQISTEEKAAEKSLDADLEQIKRQAAILYEENTLRRAQVQQTYSELQLDLQSLHENLSIYSQITFRNYFSQILSPEPPKTFLSRTLLLGAPIFLLIAGFFQSAYIAGSELYPK